MKELLERLLAEAHPQVAFSPAVREKMLTDLVLQFEQRLHEAFFLALPTAADRANYQQQLLDGATAEQLKPWLTEKIPDVSELVQYIFDEFKHDYLTVCAQ